MEIKTVEDAIDAYKSFDGWQYADREATWKWMFEHGRAVEREACAIVCESRVTGGLPLTSMSSDFDCEAVACANEIRSMRPDSVDVENKAHQTNYTHADYGFAIAAKIIRGVRGSDTEEILKFVNDTRIVNDKYNEILADYEILKSTLIRRDAEIEMLKEMLLKLEDSK